MTKKEEVVEEISRPTLYDKTASDIIDEAKQSNKSSPVERTKFSTKVELSFEDEIKMKNIFSNHEKARFYAIEAITKKPNITIRDLKYAVRTKLREHGIETIVPSMLFNELKYLLKHRSNIPSGLDRRVKHLTFSVDDICNEDFTVSKRMTRIIVEDADVTLKLEDEFPDMTTSSGIFYVNLSTTSLATLSDLRLTVYYDKPI